MMDKERFVYLLKTLLKVDKLDDKEYPEAMSMIYEIADWVERLLAARGSHRRYYR